MSNKIENRYQRMKLAITLTCEPIAMAVAFSISEWCNVEEGHDIRIWADRYWFLRILHCDTGWSECVFVASKPFIPKNREILNSLSSQPATALLQLPCLGSCGAPFIDYITQTLLFWQVFFFGGPLWRARLDCSKFSLPVDDC